MLIAPAGARRISILPIFTPRKKDAARLHELSPIERRMPFNVILKRSMPPRRWLVGAESRAAAPIASEEQCIIPPSIGMRIDTHR